MRFLDAIAVVTGAGSGIGASVAMRMAKEGARVVLVGRTLAKLEHVAGAIEEECGRAAASVFAADVTQEDEIEGLAAFVQSEFGNVHILINNAGGSGQSSPILKTKTEDWDLVQSANLGSVFLVSKHIGKLMTEAAKAEPEAQLNRSIVNVASLSGYKAGAQIPHYSAAKAGVINFSRALAFELAPYGIRVNSVSPGFVETPLTAEGLQNARFEEAIQRKTALRRIGKPEEIANVITFIASPEASYMTGSDVLVDGGWLIV
ncbi:SDR family NAD(P)-dependent oxidoreductase [Aneurinibacillus tyrosinisolvens]|uniref:SDR family NAD(P)-dependent oxidoreductase n=1 Tax=Aneurinibacillus tyrosinisolvens TaxID=1443435 RepID=UPI00063F36D7|nr:SDR family oxidoreductase [Aneurinibacillus tyrosinisolvens]